MWTVEKKSGGIYSAHFVTSPEGEQEMEFWHVYGLAANVVLGSVSVFPEMKVARVNKWPIADGESIEIILDYEEREYPIRLFPQLFLVNRAK